MIYLYITCLLTDSSWIKTLLCKLLPTSPGMVRTFLINYHYFLFIYRNALRDMKFFKMTRVVFTKSLTTVIKSLFVGRCLIYKSFTLKVIITFVIPRHYLNVYRKKIVIRFENSWMSIYR